MEEKQSYNMVNIMILNVLKNYSDENHRLSQQRLQELLEQEYNVKVDRKTVRRNLSKLIENGFPIKYRGIDNDNETITRKSKSGEDEIILTDWYYAHEFTDGELRLLIDNVLFSDGISKKQRNDLISKLEMLSNKYFRSITTKIDMDIYDRLSNSGILFIIESIGEAISKGKQLVFNYCYYDSDCKPYIKLDNNGVPKRYVVNPYQLISKNGHSYLICNLPQYDDLTHFRVDRIKNSEVLDTPAKQLRELSAFKAGIRLSDYIKEHPNLWSGTPVPVTFKCNKSVMGDIIDSFGTNLKVTDLHNDMIEVRVYVSEDSMFHWAVQFSDEVEVVSPKNLRKRIADTLRKALEKYDN